MFCAVTSQQVTPNLPACPRAPTTHQVMMDDTEGALPAVLLEAVQFTEALANLPRV